MSDGGSDVGVRFEQAGPIATVTLSRPDVLNAQTPAMWAELGNISRKLPGDVRVVIVRGEGRAFSAGLDLSITRGEGDSSLAELARLSPVDCAERIAGFQSGFTWLRHPSLVTLAAVRGFAIGAGFQLALNCDVRVLAEDAQLAMAEVTLGLVPDLGGTKRLVEFVGPSRALEICLTGRRIAADEAERALIWKARKAAFAAMGRISSHYYVQDGVIPRTRLPEVLDKIDALAQEYGMTVANVFHAGDGNLHPLVLFDEDKPGETERTIEAGAEIMRLCAEKGGTLSGEHGIGIEKKDLMPLIFSEDDVEVMQRVKRGLDPDGYCNPDKVFPTPGRCLEMFGRKGMAVGW